MSKENKYQPGCYGDGSFGPDHTMKKCISLALDAGYTEQEDKDILERWLSGDMLDPDELYIMECIEDDCIDYLDYLNEHCSDEGFYWGYETGGFGYWEIDEE